MISIVTVCHRSWKPLAGYVDSFLEHHTAGQGATIEFILVENSGDPRTGEIAARLRNAGFVARVVEMPNRGFGAGCNLGAAHAEGNILVFANPDIRFLGSIAALDGFFTRHLWGTVRQIAGNGSEYCLDLFPEHRGLLSEALRVHRYIHRLAPLRRFCYPVGSFFVVNKALCDRAGGFDERFFLYFEEAELSRRLQAIAGPPALNCDVAIWHEGLGTQPSAEFAIGEEARGFATYCAVTGQHDLLRRRARVLRFLGRWSTMAAKRAVLLETAASTETGV